MLCASLCTTLDIGAASAWNRAHTDRPLCLPAVLVLQLITCNMCGCGKYMDAVFTVLAAAWWLVAGFITAAHARAANASRPVIPQQDWRNAVVLLCWITSGLFGALFFVHLMRIGVSCCKKSRKGSSADADLEKANLRKADRPPSAAVELGKEVASRPYMLGRFGGKGSKESTASTYLNPTTNI